MSSPDTDATNMAGALPAGARESGTAPAPIGMLLLDSSAYPDGVPTESAYLGRSDVEILYREAKGCTVDRLVYEGDPALEEALIASARELVDEGARAITGDCGFMLRHQDAVANAVSVPVLLSGLLLAPVLLASIGSDGKLGIITADGPSLTPELLRRAGLRDQDRVVIAGLEDKPAFRAAIIDCTSGLDRDAVEAEVMDVAQVLVAANPDVSMILLECTALPRFAPSVQRSLGLPVFDLIRLIDLFAAAEAPPANQQHM